MPIIKVQTQFLVAHLNPQGNMLLNLQVQIHELSHISTEQIDTIQHISCLRNILDFCVTKLRTNIHVGRAQINTMKTQTGIELRKLILSTMSNIEAHLCNDIGNFTEISRYLQSNVESANDTISVGKHLITDYKQRQRRMASNKETINRQLKKHIEIKEQKLKQEYLQNMCRQYSVKFDQVSDRNTFECGSDNTIHNYPLNYYEEKDREIRKEDELCAHGDKLRDFQLRIDQVKNQINRLTFVYEVLGYFESNQNSQINQQPQIPKPNNQTRNYESTGNEKSRHSSRVAADSEQLLIG